MNSPYASIALIAVLVLLMYFVILRPQKKRQQAQAQTLKAVEPGTRVMLTSGIFATVVAVGEKQMVVETSPGVQLTILKQAMSKAVPAGDEDAPGLLTGADHGTDAHADGQNDGQHDNYVPNYTDTYVGDAGQSADGVWPPTGSNQAAPNAWAPSTETGQAADGRSTSSQSSLGDSSLTSSSFDRPEGSDGSNPSTGSTKE